MDQLKISQPLSQSNNQNAQINQELENEIVELCEPIVVIEQMEILPQIELDQAQISFKNSNETKQVEEI